MSRTLDHDPETQEPDRDDVSRPPSPSHDEIATRAYELYILRGQVDGYDLNDWLAAEAELLAVRRDTES